MSVTWNAAAAAALLCAPLFAPVAAQAIPVTSMLVMKAADSSPGDLDPYLDWISSGGVNEGASGSTALVNNGVDYKDSWVDTHWGDVLQVRVSMFTSGIESAFMLFDAAGTTKTDFFQAANLIDSSWTDTAGSGNYFSIAGDTGNNRHWFVNNNYGGCESDVGHFVVLDGGGGVCAWEASRSVAGLGSRGFLYSTDATETNWTTGNVAVADVFAVQVIVAASDVPLPAAGGLIVAGLGALGLVGRRRKA